MRPAGKTLLVTSLIGIAIAVPALAQQPSEYPAPCEPSKVSRGDVDRAHTVFLSGKGFLDEANYDKAISYFKDAYSIDCSVHGILPIIATAYERKGDRAGAIAALEEYVKRAPTASDREIIERRIKNLKDQLAQAAAAAAAASAPSATSTATPAGSGVSPAPTEPTATSTPWASPTSTGPTPQVTHSTTPWIVAGAGGALVATGIVLFAVGAGDVSSAESQCPSHMNCSNKSAADQGNTGRTLETVGVIAGAVGLAGAAGGLVWHFMEASSYQSAGARVAPVVAPAFAGLSVAGSF
jgi:hypothetical protein